MASGDVRLVEPDVHAVGTSLASLGELRLPERPSCSLSPVTGGGVGPDQTVAYPNYQTILTRLIVVPRSLATEPNVVACPDSLLLLVESASSSWG